MTSLENRPNTALLVIDVQNSVVERAYERDKVVANINALVEHARNARVPVVWVQHSEHGGEGIARGSRGWQIVPELSPRADEPRVDKHYSDAFAGTTLESVLAGLGVGLLFVSGAQTHVCIRSTLHGALVRGYDTILVSDAHTCRDETEWGALPPDQVIAHTNLYWSDEGAPGRIGRTVTTADISFDTEV